MANSNKQKSQQQKPSEEKQDENLQQSTKELENETNATHEEAVAVNEGNDTPPVTTAAQNQSLDELRNEDLDKGGQGEGGDDIKRGPETHWQATAFRAGASAPLNALILKQDEELHFEGERHDNIVKVTKDVYREVYPHNSLRPTYILVYREGTMIPANTLRAQQMDGANEEKKSEEDSE